LLFVVDRQDHRIHDVTDLVLANRGRWAVPGNIGESHDTVDLIVWKKLRAGLQAHEDAKIFDILPALKGEDS
jgi:hypothetical protein